MNGYRVYRAEGGGALALITSEALSKETLTYTDEGRTNGTEYRYSVRSVSSAGAESNDSNIRLATPLAPPAAPRLLTVAPGDTEVTVSWPAPSAEDTATHYRIERLDRTYQRDEEGNYVKRDGQLIPIDSQFRLVATVPVSSGSQRLAAGAMLAYIDPVSNSADYRYRARAVNANGAESANSAIAPPLFHLHANGVTILCPFADVMGTTGGTSTGTVNGDTYTKRTKTQITTATIAAESCTSGITDMESLISRLPNHTMFNRDISHWDTSRVKTMENIFNNVPAFDQDIGNWNVAAVENMNGMFWAAINFNRNIGGWNVAAVTDMSNMFASANAFVQNIGSWDVSSVKLMGAMFWNADNFNQDISGWNVTAVTDMRSMFNGAPAFNQNLSGWCVRENVRRDDFANGATMFTSGHPNWDWRTTSADNPPALCPR